jgi:mRNA interferase MazF
MITSAENRGWPGDLHFGTGYSAAGLPAPSIVRTAKIATVEARHVEPIGRASSEMVERVEQEITRVLGFS